MSTGQGDPESLNMVVYLWTLEAIRYFKNLGNSTYYTKIGKVTNLFCCLNVQRKNQPGRSLNSRPIEFCAIVILVHYC